MQRDRQRSQTRAPTGRVTGRGANATLDVAPRPLIYLLAHAERITDVLPHLHQHALEITGGSCSLLLEQNPRIGAMQATSGFGLEALPVDPLTVTPEEEAVIERTFATGMPTLVIDAARQAPRLA